MSDKYPEESNRRRFVKGVVGGAALAGSGTVGAVSVDSLTNPTGAGGGLTQFYGVENTDGPAPRAMPQIPVELDEEGFLRGLFPDEGEMSFGSIDIPYKPEWFQYCGVQTYPGVQPGADQDNYFRYAEGPPDGLSWQTEVAEPGDRVNIEHFADYEDWGNDIGDSGLGKPARVTWRSQGLDSEVTMICEVVRSTRVEEMANQSDWIADSTQEGFIAYLDKCTHFCCVPSFKGIQGSVKFEAENDIYCPCHQSVYDPFSIIRGQYVALPRPEG